MNKKDLLWELTTLKEQNMDGYDLEYMFGYRSALDEAIDLIMPFLVKIKETENEI